jgi:hypothetical protein
MVVHPPSIRPFGLAALASSGPVALRHPKLTTYRCFLPDLTGFIALRRVGPGPQRCSAQPVPRYTNLGREFSPAIAACGYRAPLAPRLARPPRSYHAQAPRQEHQTCPDRDPVGEMIQYICSLTMVVAIALYTARPHSEDVDRQDRGSRLIDVARPRERDRRYRRRIRLRRPTAAEL